MTPAASRPSQELSFMTPAASRPSQELSFMTPAASRPTQELSFMTPVDTYIPQMPLCMNNEGVKPPGLGCQNKETALVHNFESILPALPPSFASFLMDCSGLNHGS